MAADSNDGGSSPASLDPRIWTECDGYAGKLLSMTLGAEKIRFDESSATWTIEHPVGEGLAGVRVRPGGPSQPEWLLAFEQMGGKWLEEKRYDNVHEPHAGTYGPQMSISLGDECDRSVGWFEVRDMAFDDNEGEFVRFTAAFEEYCDGMPVLRGCVHW